MDKDAASKLSEDNKRARSIRGQLEEARRQGDNKALRELSVELRRIKTQSTAAELSRIGKDFIALRTMDREILIPNHRIGRVVIKLPLDQPNVKALMNDHDIRKKNNELPKIEL